MEDEPRILLQHGTTRQRAESIVQNGPDLNFYEPGDFRPAEGFSTVIVGGPCFFGDPKVAAFRKAKLFPNEGGPAILEIEVPESIVRMADLIGEVRFEIGFGFEELLAVWASLPKRILVP